MTLFLLYVLVIQINNNKRKKTMNDYIIWFNKNKLIYRIEILNKDMFKIIQNNKILKRKYFRFLEIINDNVINFVLPKTFYNTILVNFVRDMENIGFNKHSYLKV